jgi:hypothetical protein
MSTFVPAVLNWFRELSLLNSTKAKEKRLLVSPNPAGPKTTIQFPIPRALTTLKLEGELTSHLESSLGKVGDNREK